MTQEEMEAEYRRVVGREALGYMAFGAVMLGMALYLASDHVPLLRQGRLLLGFVIGAACLGWGAFRWFNRSTRYDF